MCQSPEKPKESAVIFSVGLVGLFFGTSLHVALLNFASGDIYILICLSMDIGKKKFLWSTFYLLTSTILFVALIYPG